MASVPAYYDTSEAPDASVGRGACERLRSVNRRTDPGASVMARKTASGQDGPSSAVPNALQKLIRERMAEMNWTYEDVEKRGGPSHSTLYSLVTRPEFRVAPRADTLKKLARGLDLPMDIVMAATGQASGYSLEAVPTTLDSAKGLRMVAATFEKLDTPRQRTAERIMRALLDEMKDESQTGKT